MRPVEGAPGARLRLHTVPGVYNLRDTGGYAAAEGTTRWQKLLRSDGLHRLGDGAHVQLTQLGVAHVLDLRSSGERAAYPSRLDGLDAIVHHVPIFESAEPTALAANTTGLASVYDRIVDQHGTRLAEALRVILSVGDAEAVLVHCTAGKDRTGIVVGFALAAVGVAVEDVAADYALTAANLAGAWADEMLASVQRRGHVLTDGIVELVTASPAPVMAALLVRVSLEYGSVAQYLRAHGLTEDELGLLQRSLVA